MIRPTRTLALFFALSITPALSLAPAFAGTKPADKPSTVVDEGTFAVFQGGRRVATEVFTIRQYADSSITSSQLKIDSGPAGSTLDQTSELVLHPDASIVHYDWRQTSPTRSSAVVEPSNEFLTMHIEADGKVSDLPFFLTPSAFILDDYFFSTREVLLWRYLASCKVLPNGNCERTRFAVLVPRRRTSSEVFIEFKGYDDTPLNGRPQHLRHFLMQTEGTDWHLWLDPSHKLLRISIPDANTEVLRQEVAPGSGSKK
jgi:hypothetical protein